MSNPNCNSISAVHGSALNPCKTFMGDGGNSLCNCSRRVSAHFFFPLRAVIYGHSANCSRKTAILAECDMLRVLYRIRLAFYPVRRSFHMSMKICSKRKLLIFRCGLQKASNFRELVVQLFQVPSGRRKSATVTSPATTGIVRTVPANKKFRLGTAKISPLKKYLWPT